MLVGTEILRSIHRWDVSTFRRVLLTHRYRPLVSLAFWTSKTADGWIYLLLPIGFYLSGYADTALLTSTLVLAFALERIVYLSAKKVFERKRPQNILPDVRSIVVASDEFSFPSGHTSGAFLAITVLTLIASPLFAVFYVWSIAVGCSRVVLGVHFPSDIFIGALLGTAAANFALHYIVVAR